MLITRKSILTGIERTIDIPVTQDQIDTWMNGTLIQTAMPNIDMHMREFIMTGITSDEWEGLADENDFGDEPENEEA